jgi:hypothetical protein
MTDMKTIMLQSNWKIWEMTDWEFMDNKGLLCMKTEWSEKFLGPTMTEKVSNLGCYTMRNFVN